MKSKWESVKLSEIAEINMGQSPASSSYNDLGNGEIFYQGNRDFGSLYPSVSAYTTEPKKIANSGDVLMSVRAPVGELNIANKRCCIGRGLAAIRLKADHSRFLYYVLKYSMSKLHQVSTGTTFSSINKTDLTNLEILLPSLQIQKKIAHILATLDDKIELNRKMNQTLEDLAQALFKSWFVDFDPVHAKADAKSDADMDAVAAELGISKEVLELFPSEFEESEMGMIPKGWEVKDLKGFGRVITGKTPPKKVEDAYNNDGKPFITPTDIDDSLFVTFTNRHLSDRGQLAIKNTAIGAGSICVTCIGSQMGKTIIAPVDSFTNQQINSIVVDSENLRNYLFYNLRSRKKEIFLMGSGGSTMPLLNKSSFEKIKVLLPSQQVLEGFNAQIKDKLALVLENDLQSMTLSKTRDTLLPKLLTGELDVSNINIGVKK